MVYSVNGNIFHFGIYVSDCPIIGLLIDLELTTILHRICVLFVVDAKLWLSLCR